MATDGGDSWITKRRKRSEGKVGAGSWGAAFFTLISCHSIFLSALLGKLQLPQRNNYNVHTTSSNILNQFLVQLSYSACFFCSSSWCQIIALSVTKKKEKKP